MEIKSLQEDVKTLLRSGVNINNISKCLKELILNSLDAKSTSVAVRVNFVTFRFQIVDNGKGITKSNMNSVGLQYMTNKCHSLDDLKKTTRFGFRGEAFASICNLSETVTVVSKSVQEANTYRKIYENNAWSLVELVKQRPSWGTTVTINGFLHNMPVRQKRVNENLDLNELKHSMESLAIIHPRVSFNLRNDITGKIVFHSTKTHSVLESLVNIYPNIVSEDLHQVNISKGKIAVSGLIYKKTSSSKLQFIYLNKRPINSQKIQNLLNTLLKKIGRASEKLPNDTSFIEHPVYVINITCPYTEVDLTLTSSKQNVEFKQWDVIFKFIEKAANSAMKKSNSCASIVNNQVQLVVEAEVHKSQFGVSQIQGAVRSFPIKRKIADSPIKDNNRITLATDLLENMTDPSLKINAENELKSVGIIENKNKKGKRMKLSISLQKKKGNLLSKDKVAKMDQMKLKNIEESNENELIHEVISETCKKKLESEVFKMPERKVPKKAAATKNVYKANENIPLPVRNEANSKITQNKTQKNVKRKIFNNENKTFSEVFNLNSPKKINQETDGISPLVPNLRSQIEFKKPIKNIFDKHQNTQSLVLNSESNVSKSTADLLNYTINLVESQDVGKNLIMDMFLKSTLVFPYKEAEINDNVKTTVVETTKHNLITTCRTNNHNVNTTTAMSMKIMSRTIVTNSLHALCNRNKNTTEGVRKEMESRKEMKSNKVSKCVQTTMIEQQNKFNFTIKNVTEGNMFNANGENHNVTFSKYFMNLHHQHKPQTNLGKHFVNRHHNENFTTGGNIGGFSTNAIQIPRFGDDDAWKYPSIPNNGYYPSVQQYNDISIYPKPLHGNHFHNNYEFIPNAYNYYRKPIKDFSSYKKLDFTNFEEFDEPYKEFMQEKRNHHHGFLKRPNDYENIPMFNTNRRNKYESNDKNTVMNIWKPSCMKNKYSVFGNVQSLNRPSAEFYNFTNFDHGGRKNSEFYLPPMMEDYQWKRNENYQRKKPAVKQPKLIPQLALQNLDRRKDNFVADDRCFSPFFAKPKEYVKKHREPPTNFCKNLEENKTGGFWKTKNPCVSPYFKNKKSLNFFNRGVSKPTPTQQEKVRYYKQIPIINQQHSQRNCDQFYIPMNNFQNNYARANSRNVLKKYNTDFPLQQKTTLNFPLKKKLQKFYSEPVYTSLLSTVQQPNSSPLYTRTTSNNEENNARNGATNQINNPQYVFSSFVDEINQPCRDNFTTDQANFTILNTNNNYTNCEVEETEFHNQSNNLETENYNNFNPVLSSTHYNAVDESLLLVKNTREQGQCDINSDLVIEGTPVLPRTKNDFVDSNFARIASGNMYNYTPFEHCPAKMDVDDNLKLEFTPIIAEDVPDSSALNISIDTIKRRRLMERDLANEHKNNNSEVTESEQIINNFEPTKNQTDKESDANNNNNNDFLKQAIENNSFQQINRFGNEFYLHKRTGMTFLSSPKQDFPYNLTKRQDFLPKGMSPILKEAKTVDTSLSPISKKNLHATIMKNYEEELNTIKWSNYLRDCKDVNEFFEKLYREKSKQFEEFVPTENIAVLPKSMVKLWNNLRAQPFTKDIFNELNVIGQLDNKFIVTILKDKKQIVLFDQHAVDERVRLEKLLDDYMEKDVEQGQIRFKSTKCANAVLLNLMVGDINILQEFETFFASLGLFYIIGENNIKISHIPTCIYRKFHKSKKPEKQADLETVLKSLIHNEISMIISTRGVISKIPNILQNLINTEACRGAIKFGDNLSIGECQRHLKELSTCQLPFQCAHGRPTLTPVIDLNQQFVKEARKPNLKKLKQML